MAANDQNTSTAVLARRPASLGRAAAVAALFVAVLLAWAWFNRSDEAPLPPGRVIRYYESFKGHSLPLRPVGALTQEQALARKRYCVFEYEDGRIMHFFMMQDGKHVPGLRYRYDADGKLVSSVSTKPSDVIGAGPGDRDGD